MNHLSIRSHIIWNTLFIYVSGRLWYSRATSNVVPAGLSHLQAQVPQRVGDSNRAGQVVLANAPLFLNLGCFPGSMLGGDHWGVVITYIFLFAICIYLVIFDHYSYRIWLPNNVDKPCGSGPTMATMAALFAPWRCLYQWFRTSSKTTCPLCNQPLGSPVAEGRASGHPVTPLVTTLVYYGSPMGGKIRKNMNPQ